MLAGIDAHIIDTIWMAIGSVISVLSTASAWPTSDAITIWPAMMLFSSAWQQNSSHTLRFMRRAPPRRSKETDISWTLVARVKSGSNRPGRGQEVSHPGPAP